MRQITKNLIKFSLKKFLKSTILMFEYKTKPKNNFFNIFFLVLNFSSSPILQNSNKKKFIAILLLMAFWFKIRILYYLNNWIYTTNHKRIAVNYFWFVILSGIIGMVLATVIRLEFAYPGVGIFAGDSLQYLSLVSAHGVIMVFFMIMPLLFGAFANFLLPTQLGVHDVAFPRLNSAAFWFLPGGLLMLAQLVCVDRRYQRMNCFNIREIQSILKKRFFVDLINAHDHKNLLHKTMIDLKFKTNNSAIDSEMFIFYNYGIEILPKIRQTGLFSEKNSLSNHFEITKQTSVFYSFVSSFETFSFFKILNKIFFLIINFDQIFRINFTFMGNFKLFFQRISTFLKFSENKILSNYDKVVNTFVVLFTDNYTKKSKIFHYQKLNFSDSLKAVREKTRIFLLSHLSRHLDYYCLWLDLKNGIIDFYNYFPYSVYEIYRDRGLQAYFSKKKLTLNFNFDKISISEFFNSLEISTVFNFITKEMFNFRAQNTLNFSNKISNSYHYHLSFLENSFLLGKLSLLFSTSDYENFSSSDMFSLETEDKIFDFNNNSTDLLNLKFFYSNFNYNSYFVYFFILTDMFLQFPIFLWNLGFGIFDFKKISTLLNNFTDLTTIWYLPLLVNDNIFYVFWKKSHNCLFFEKKDFSFNFINIFIERMFTPLYDNFAGVSLSYFSILKKKNFSFVDIFEYLFLEMTTLVYNVTSNKFVILTNFFFNFKNYQIFETLFNLNFVVALSETSLKFKNNTLLNFNSSHFTNNNLNTRTLYGNEEIFSNYRYQKFDNPVFKYDYKSGDYYPKLYKEMYSYLFSSAIDLTGGLRQAPWFYSFAYFDLFSQNFNKSFTNFSKNTNPHVWNQARFSNIDGFYTFFFIFANDTSVLNKRWVSVNTLDQKFIKFFHTSSMQQRIYSNWRQLKFTREAWRCKLLMARHQKTLFKRYVNEDGVFWSIERNAKDLLPGWAMITPFSSRTRFTAVGKVDIGLMGVLLVLNSSIISGANFLVTYRYLSTLNNRKMRDARSFFTEAVMVASWMMIAANPMLIIGIIMLLSDRHWQTSFFDYSGGGDTVLFQHMFWFFGHPEVYVIILPTFGFTNTMISYYLRKRVSARASLLYSMYTIAFLGFFVWGHHMYMVGLAHTTRMLFSTLTVMISVPAATKLMHWCVTIVNSSFAIELPLLCTITFVFLFVSGGISGMCVAHTGMDILFHDTFYVIGHFHVMLAGAAMIASFGAFYFYFVAIFGVKYSRIYAYLHFTYYLLGQLFTVIPMFWLGYAGMPRRVLDYPASFGGWHSVISGGHMLSVAGLIAFFIMIFDSLRQAKAVTRNTFGINRYNIRLNFYIYEIAKLNNIQQKAWTLFKFLRPHSLKLNNSNFTNLEHLETTLLSYSFIKK